MDFYEQWLEEVEPLLEEAERRAFEQLEGPGSRERFLRGFWQARPMRLLERWRENREARDQLRERSPAMERAVLLAGKPADRQTIEPCESELRRIEIWTWDGWRLQHQLGRPPPPDEAEIVLAFVQQVNFDPRSMRLWSPASGVDLTFARDQSGDGRGRADATPAGALRVLDQAERRRCMTPGERHRLEQRLNRAVGWHEFIDRLGWKGGAASDGETPGVAGGEQAVLAVEDPGAAGWVDRFLRVEAVLEPDAMAAPGVTLDFEPLGTENRRTALRGRLRLPASHLTAIGAGQILDRVTITGDVFLRDRLVDTFVATHHVTGGAVSLEGVSDATAHESASDATTHQGVSDATTLGSPVLGAASGATTFQSASEATTLEGDSDAATHEGSAGGTAILLDFYRRLPAGAYRLEVRAEDGLGRGLYRASRTLEVPALQVPPDLPDLGLLSRRETIVLNQLPSVELLAPAGRVLGSTFTAWAVASPAVAEVVFLRDGEQVADADGPPFARELVLPLRRHRIEVRGHDAQGRLVARHSLDVEREEHPFSVALERPDPALHEQALDLAVRVDLPSGRELRQVVCDLDGQPLQTTPTPPFRCRVPAGLRLPLSFVRAVATLRSGEQVEDLVFLGSGAGDEIEVRLVDLLVSVGGGQAGPARNLDATDFRVIHRGVPARIREFRSLADRPLTVALLMDVSSSMGRRVRVAATSAQRFFERVLTKRDAASLIVFNHDLDRLLPFSGDTRLLSYAAEGLRAWGATRLHDGIAYAVSSFAGRPDRRALVVLSDGADTDSDLDFEAVLEQAERAGIVVYPIALRVTDAATTEALGRLAERTGGQYHEAGSVEELDRIYRDIEQALRSWYLIAFEPPPGVEARADGLRDIQVEVLPAGSTVTGVRIRGQ